MEWISVYDSLPQTQWAERSYGDSMDDISGQVLILTEHGAIGAAAYHRSKGVWFSGGLTKECGYQEFRPQIFYWMPFPPPIDKGAWHSLEARAKADMRVSVPL